MHSIGDIAVLARRKRRFRVRLRRFRGKFPEMENLAVGNRAELPGGGSVNSMSGNLLAGVHPSCSRRGAPPKRRAAAATAAATEGNPAFPAEIGTKDESWTCMLPAPKLGGAQLCLQILSGGHPPRRNRRSPPRRPTAAVQIHNP